MQHTRHDSRDRRGHTGLTGLSMQHAAVAGFTLVGLLSTLFIIGVLTTLMVPHFSCEIQKSKMAAAKADLSFGADAIESYEVEHGSFPYKLEDAYGREEPPGTLIYCLDDDDGNSGHGNEVCSFLDTGNSSGQNEHGGVDNMGYSLRTVDSLAPCKEFSLSWTMCCGREPLDVAPGDEETVPGHPGK